MLKLSKFDNFDINFKIKKNYFWKFFKETIEGLFSLEIFENPFNKNKLKKEIKNSSLSKLKETYENSKKIKWNEIWEKTINVPEIKECFEINGNSIQTPFSFDWKIWKNNEEIDFLKTYDYSIESSEKYFKIYRAIDIFSHDEQNELEKIKNLKKNLTKKQILKKIELKEKKSIWKKKMKILI